jgi:Na+(H+)/acetate symporter ActP
MDPLKLNHKSLNLQWIQTFSNVLLIVETKSMIIMIFKKSTKNPNCNLVLSNFTLKIV